MRNAFIILLVMALGACAYRSENHADVSEAAVARVEAEKPYVAEALGVSVSRMDCRIKAAPGGHGGAYVIGSNTLHIGTTHLRSRLTTQIIRHELTHCALRHARMTCHEEEFLAYKVAGMGDRSARHRAERSCSKMGH